MPRWSVAGHATPAPRAGLPAAGMAVGLAPPWSASAPSRGSAKVVVGVHGASSPPPTTCPRGHCRSPSPVPVTWHCIGAPGFCAVLFANRSLVKVNIGFPPIAAPKSASPPSAWLSTNVVNAIVPPPPNSDTAPPSPASALLPENVSFRNWSCVPSACNAPLPCVAVLFENVEAVTTSVLLWK